MTLDERWRVPSQGWLIGVILVRVAIFSVFDLPEAAPNKFVHLSNRLWWHDVYWRASAGLGSGKHPPDFPRLSPVTNRRNPCWFPTSVVTFLPQGLPSLQPPA